MVPAQSLAAIAASPAPSAPITEGSTSIPLKQVGKHIGRRIRQRRTERGLTQEQLGQTLGLSYQQIQKYETATNRISASRLYELACALDVGVAHFFEGLDGLAPSRAMPHGAHNRTAIDLVRNFMALEDENLRIAVCALLKALRERDVTESSPDQASQTSS